MDIQWQAGYIYGPGGPTPNGPPPLQLLTSDPIDLSAYNAPVLTLQTRFYHCCAIDHQLLIEVSTDGGASWPYSFDLAESYDRNVAPPNPTVFTFHLGEAISANPSNVTIRFNWVDTGPDANDQVAGVYNWYFDDLLLQEANKYDLASSSNVLLRDSSTELPSIATPAGRPKISHEYTRIPRCNLCCLDFGGQVCNIGHNSVNDARLQTTVFDMATGTMVWQETSPSMPLDSISCIGGNVSGYQPPFPDTVFSTPCYDLTDTGDYIVEYRAFLGDSADCDTSNNVGGYEEFSITDNEYALDEWDPGESNGATVSPDLGGGSYDEFICYNGYEFTDCSFDATKDTVKQVCFYLADTTEVGAGPIIAGVSELGDASNIYGKTAPFYANDPSDIGAWHCLDITLDSNDNPIDGLAVPVGDGILKGAFVQYTGGSNVVGFGRAGLAEYYESLVEGDFGSGGFAVYITGDNFMLRLRMNDKDQNCEPIIDTTGNDTTSLREFDDGFDRLGQNQPNPFDAGSVIRYELDEKANNVTFSIRDVTGKLVMSEGFGTQGAGEHRIDLNASDFDAGVYYYTLIVDGERSTRKMVVSE